MSDEHSNIAAGSGAGKYARQVRVVNQTGVDPIPIQGVTEGTFVPEGISKGAIQIHPLDAVTWIEAKTSATFTTRTNVAVQNQSDNGNVILWNYTGTGTDGFRITDGNFRSVLLSKDTTAKVYIKMLSGTGSAAVEELGTP
jgi:hypothetical protein